ncbi:ODV-E66 [Penaeus vannamei nudivirus]|nr:ODV-E66 [Penaeus vannamei nucleopolyhedrovirus]
MALEDAKEFFDYGQLGDGAVKTESFSLIFLLIVFIVLAIAIIYMNQPKVLAIFYQYKKNYYEPFVLPAGYDIETQGRKLYEWDTREEGIQAICKVFNKSMGYFNTNRKSANTKLGMKLMEEWIMAYLKQLRDAGVTGDGSWFGFPWGDNWYEFTISSTTFMAYYIMLKKSKPSIKRAAADAILRIITDPEHSLGWRRDKANSCMMVFPWTLAHMINGTLDTTNEGYIYAIGQYNMQPDPTLRLNEDGFHIDGAYLIHNGVYAYGYFESIYSIYPDTMQVIPEVASFNLDHWHDYWTSKLYHPTISLSGSTLFHRGRDVHCSTYKGKTWTPEVLTVPSMKYLRIFYDNMQFCVRLAGLSIVYYECDQTIYNMGLYSCLCKQEYRPGDSKDAVFPADGFIVLKGTTELVPVDPNPDNITNPTTYGYYNVPLTNKAHSLTMVDYDEGFAYFRIKHVTYEPLLSVGINESGYYDMKTKELRWYVVPQLEQLKDCSVCWGGKLHNLEDIELPDHHKAVILFTKNLLTGNTTVGPTDRPNAKFEPLIEHFNDRYSEPHTADPGDYHYPTAASGDAVDNFTVIEKDGVPFIYIPGEREIHSYEKTITYRDSKEYTFKFDEEWNQYLNETYQKANTYYK